ncbi:class I SAM-dependent methyltransferase [Streptomyces sp. LX-29]|uniref:class I SAM-dependent methyltransferase n=1 Tax=Streptomyces sp. LX-29 TaxID=2900152 RepID=UPI00240D3C4D|nr:class I SAM-dependent methyltransferase [Streptomyces sp. LX-29]WFB07312.1 class I SAM-dependent methyltransferase [Streptomyces sp. LX-29]
MTTTRAADRARLGHRIRHASRHPDRVVPYLRRLGRDWRLRLTTRDHVAYYRAVMKADTARSPSAAVGSATEERWLALGELQFDYLLRHGLSPKDRMLEIGCGNLRAGWRFIDYLRPGHYHGIDISPEILFAAADTLAERGLQSKVPHLTLVRDLRLSALPAGYFTVVHAHSVFSHSPIEVVDECLRNIARVMAPRAFFDFTFNRTEGEHHHVLREDFYYRADTLTELAASHGLWARVMEDWERMPHKQSKIRVRSVRR